MINNKSHLENKISKISSFDQDFLQKARRKSDKKNSLPSKLILKGNITEREGLIENDEISKEIEVKHERNTERRQTSNEHSRFQSVIMFLK